MELESKEKIAADDNLTKIQIAQMQLGVQQQIAAMQAHIQKLETMIGIVHETRLQEHENAHEAGMAAMAHRHATEQQDRAAEQGLISGEVEHGRALEAGEQGHGHAVDLLKRQPKPKPNGKG